MKRRSFLRGASAMALAATHTPLFADSVVTSSVRLTFGAEKGVVPQDFVGLSYETQQLADPKFFSLTAKPLIAFFRTLSRSGVLRLGGNTSANSWYKATAAAVPPPMRPVHGHETGVTSDKLQYAITPEAIHNLRAFLDATGWTCIYGLNLANGTPSSIATEAADVARILGAKLQYFAVGNEPDLFSKGVRPASWMPEDYFGEWLAACHAVVASLPHARFGAPDISNRLDWMKRFAELYRATPNQPALAAITHHYYAGGPPSDTKLTAQSLVAADSRVAEQAALAATLAKQLHTSFRVTEANTCYHGGKPLVSDNMAAALWCIEYASTLATSGYAGLNIHGGGGREVADSLGGTLPGEAFVPAWYHGSYPKPFYTPISTRNDGTLHAEPIFCGLLLMDYFAGCTLLDVTLTDAPKGFSAISARGTHSARGGSLQRTLLSNTVDGTFASVMIASREPLYVLRLEGSSLLERDVRFAGATVDAQGHLAPPVLERIDPDTHGQVKLQFWSVGAALVFHGPPDFAR